MKNMEINFFPKCHSKLTSNFPFIVNLKKPACASKQDGLVFATLRYVSVSFCIFLPSSFIPTSSAIREMRVFGLLHHHQLECRRTANEAGSQRLDALALTRRCRRRGATSGGGLRVFRRKSPFFSLRNCNCRKQMARQIEKEMKVMNGLGYFLFSKSARVHLRVPPIHSIAVSLLN